MPPTHPSTDTWMFENKIQLSKFEDLNWLYSIAGESGHIPVARRVLQGVVRNGRLLQVEGGWGKEISSERKELFQARSPPLKGTDRGLTVQMTALVADEEVSDCLFKGYVSGRG